MDFYNSPTQVLFYDGDHYVSGIAFEDKVICGCCGSVYYVEDVETDTYYASKKIAIYDLPWIDITEAIGNINDIDIEAD